jgi:CRP-like cAMP-binding protein
MDVLRNVSLFDRLADEELEHLADCLGKRVFGKGVIIFHADSPGETMYIIESGRVRIFALSESGQEICVNVYGPGDVFGEMAVLDGLPRSAGAVAVEDTVVLTLHRYDVMQTIDRCPAMAWSIIQVLSARLRYTTDYAEDLAFLDVTGRVAARLLELADRYGVQRGLYDAVQIGLEMTQGELASWVGSSRESVNKVLRRMQDKGLIEMDGQRITILDRRGLKRLVRY